MSYLVKLRESADHLLSINEFERAFPVYMEVYRQIWEAIGWVHQGITEFSRNYFITNVKASISFRNDYSVSAMNTVFTKWFELDSTKVIHEMTYSLYGKLQCISYSKKLLNKFDPLLINLDYLILYNLALYKGEDSIFRNLLRLTTPMLVDNKARKLYPLVQSIEIEDSIMKLAEKIKENEWSNINFLLLEYLENSGNKESRLFTSVNKTTNYQRFYKKDYKRKKSESKHESYERYEKYEKYERYERSERKQKSEENEFELSNATEEEKAKYFGFVLGLKGQITKTHIRKKYLELISLYHPDKVSELGEELKTLAESKTKEINIAYEWMKKKYSL